MIQSYIGGHIRVVRNNIKTNSSFTGVSSSCISIKKFNSQNTYIKMIKMTLVSFDCYFGWYFILFTIFLKYEFDECYPIYTFAKVTTW